MDIDYMIGFRILTIDKQNFNGLSNYQKELENMGIKLVLIQVNKNSLYKSFVCL